MKEKILRWTLDDALCKKCGICVAFCGRQALETDETGSPVMARAERCVGCRFCEYHCPDFAIRLVEQEG